MARESQSPEKINAAQILATMALGRHLELEDSDDLRGRSHKVSDKDKDSVTEVNRKRKREESEYNSNKPQDVADDISTPRSHTGRISLQDQKSQSSSSGAHRPSAQQADVTASTTSSSVHSSKAYPIFDALCTHPDVLLYLTTQYMHPRMLLTLYTISRPFHYMVNSHYTTYMLCSARRWARLMVQRPSSSAGVEVGTKTLWGSVSAFADRNHSQQSAQDEQTSDVKDKGRQKATPHQSSTFVFADPMQPTPPDTYNPTDITTLLPFNNYIHLCTVDPTQRRVEPSFDARAVGAPPIRSRHVPTFRYLFFLLHRASTVTNIVFALHLHGHAVPASLAPTLAKLSLLMDLPTNFSRAALLQNTRYFTHADLQLLYLFFVKLDMVFTDPLDGDIRGPQGVAVMRSCLLAQRSLSNLAQVLKRKQGRNSIEILQMWVRWKWTPRIEHRGMSILGVPAEEVGCLAWEGWKASGTGQPGREARRLTSVEDLVVTEAIKRGLEFERGLLRLMLYGYI